MSQPITNVEHMMRRLLISAQQHLDAACDPKAPEVNAFRMLVSHAALAGMCAYTLNALNINDSGEADETAVALFDMDMDGEWLTDWVREQLNARQIEASKTELPSDNPWRDLVLAYVDAEEGTQECSDAWFEMRDAVEHWRTVRTAAVAVTEPGEATAQ